MKGISPLIATVLLIAFTVAVGGLISIWITGFAKTQTQAIGSQASTSISCSNGFLSFQTNLKFCNNYLSGVIINTGSITLGNISLTITYTNATAQKIYLQLLGSSLNGTPTCCGNFSLNPNELSVFNVSIWGNNYDTIRVVSNCSGVVASTDSSGVTASCI